MVWAREESSEYFCNEEVEIPVSANQSNPTQDEEILIPHSSHENNHRTFFVTRMLMLFSMGRGGASLIRSNFSNSSLKKFYGGVGELMKY